MNLYERLERTTCFLKQKTQEFQPQIGMILGTGLSNFTQHLEIKFSISYKEIPGFAESTVSGHKGELICAEYKGLKMLVMSGRFHYYEGYSMDQVIFPVRVMKFLGIQKLIISNAAGGVQAHIYPGDLVFIRDHINLLPENPLRGQNDERIGLRFPDMLNTYNREWNKKALSIAKKKNIRAHEGVYVATQGPNLETPAEYRFFNIIGGDVVGMSTIPEVLAAKHMNLPVFVISVVSNRCFPIEELTETSLEEVLQVVNAAEKDLTAIMLSLLTEIQR